MQFNEIYILSNLIALQILCHLLAHKKWHELMHLNGFHRTYLKWYTDSFVFSFQDKCLVTSIYFRRFHFIGGVDSLLVDKSDNLFYTSKVYLILESEELSFGAEAKYRCSIILWENKNMNLGKEICISIFFLWSGNQFMGICERF